MSKDEYVKKLNKSLDFLLETQKHIKIVWLQDRIEDLRDIINTNNILIEDLRKEKDFDMTKNLEKTNQYLVHIMNAYSLEMTKL